MKEKEREAHVSTARHTKEKDAWVHGANEDARRTTGPEKEKGERSPKAGSLTKTGDFRFGREYRLLKKREFDQVFKEGKKFRGDRMEFIYLSNKLKRSRLGLVVSRKAGNAAVRNGKKRALREIFRLHRSSLTTDIDLIIRAYHDFQPFTFREAQKEFLRFAARL